MSALAALAAATLVACGSSGGSGSESTSTNGAGAGGDGQPSHSLTVVTPFPAASVFYPLYVAKERGYFEKEGLDVTVESADGSGDAMRAVLTGNAEVAGPGPSTIMQAVAKGADVVDVYTLYQSNTFQWVVPADSSITDLQGLKGKKIGVSALTAGEVPIVVAAMAEAGLEQHEDYTLLAVGDGGSATVALQKGDVDAYASAFVDIATMKLRGLDVRNIMPAEFSNFPDTQFAVSGKFAEENPKVVEGFGRALAKAEAWATDQDPEAIAKIAAKYVPSEGDDLEFTTGLVEATSDLFALPEGADGQWGYTDMDAIQNFMQFLIDQGELDDAVDLDSIFVSGKYLDAYNDFSAEDL